MKRFKLTLFQRMNSWRSLLLYFCVSFKHLLVGDAVTIQNTRGLMVSSVAFNRSLIWPQQLFLRIMICFIIFQRFNLLNLIWLNRCSRDWLESQVKILWEIFLHFFFCGVFVIHVCFRNFTKCPVNFTTCSRRQHWKIWTAFLQNRFQMATQSVLFFDGNSFFDFCQIVFSQLFFASAAHQS